MAEDVDHHASISAPLVHKFDRPLQLFKQTLVKGIGRLEVCAPIIKEQLQEIYNQAKSKVVGTVKPYTKKVCKLRQASKPKAASLKELSWKKANEVASQYGTIAVNGVDTTAQLAERLLDYYFPKFEGDDEGDNARISIKEDPALHTVKSLHKEDVKEYVVRSVRPASTSHNTAPAPA
ncbi:AAEL009997-PA [Aedes aegypti]|uniref:AAEL009997-PA n=1 Tax=Aedes aegypti TaxID=7159 RepID=Q16U67_AEDAE|nr:AAEL009997-PA [Aedes aegypti]